MPLCATCQPKRCSSVSSTAMRSGSSPATKTSMTIPSRVRLSCSADQTAQLRTGWYVVKWRSSVRPMAHKAEAMVRRLERGTRAIGGEGDDRSGSRERGDASEDGTNTQPGRPHPLGSGGPDDHVPAIRAIAVSVQRDYAAVAAALDHACSSTHGRRGVVKVELVERGCAAAGSSMFSVDVFHWQHEGPA